MPMDGWSLAYADARAETEVQGQTPVLSDINAARTWLGEVMERIALTDP